MEIYLKNLQSAQEKIKKIENLIVLAQITKNKNLMLITLEELEKALKDCINSALHLDYIYKRVKLSQDPIQNFKTFETKSSKNYNLTNQELNLIKEILNTTKEHKKSDMEFIRKEELIILSNDNRIFKISMERLTTFLSLIKGLSEKIKAKIKG